MASSFRPRATGGRAANASGNIPDRLRPRALAAAEQLGQLGGRFAQAGYSPLTPDWPDDPATVEAARANPGVFARKTLEQIRGAHHRIIRALDTKPAIVGHSTGGLLAQMLAGRGLWRRRWRSTGSSEVCFLCRSRR